MSLTSCTAGQFFPRHALYHGLKSRHSAIRIIR
jgi:hypothetical protein